MNEIMLVDRKLIVTKAKSCKYPMDKLMDLLEFSRQLLPVNPHVHIGTTYRGWKGWARRYEISIYLGRRHQFPTKFTPKYCFQDSRIPDCKIDWDDAFVVVAAHEFYHVYQRMKGVPMGERDAEFYCVGRLLAYLKLKGIKPPMMTPERRVISGIKMVNGQQVITKRYKYVWNHVACLK